jgi:hypothetical protein
MKKPGRRILLVGTTANPLNQRNACPTIDSGSLSIEISDWAQVHGQLLLGVEDSPLNRADGNRLGGSDLMVFPFVNKAQPHRLALLIIEEFHPIFEF